jgi:hypothetical protein
MVSPKFVFLNGYAGSGKDAVGKILSEKGYARYAFADSVKVHVAQKFSIPLELTQTQSGKGTLINNKSVRTYLIEESALMKVVSNDPAYWAKIVAQNVVAAQAQLVVITDWRYIAEYEQFRILFPNSEFTTIRILRNSVQPINDPSEHELDHIICDYTLQNHTTLEDLKKQLTLLPI